MALLLDFYLVGSIVRALALGVRHLHFHALVRLEFQTSPTLFLFVHR